MISVIADNINTLVLNRPKKKLIIIIGKTKRNIFDNDVTRERYVTNATTIKYIMHMQNV